MKNSADQSGCHEPKPKAEVDDTLWGLRNSSYLTKAKFALLFIQNIKGENELFVFLLTKNDTTSSPGLGFSINSSKPCSVKIFAGSNFLQILRIDLNLQKLVPAGKKTAKYNAIKINYLQSN